MLLNFAEYTEPLTEKEKKLIVPYVTYLLNYAYGKKNAKKAYYIAKHLREHDALHNLGVGTIDNVLIGKMTHTLRASQQVPNLIGTSDGYFIANHNEIKEVNNGIESLRQRARSINFAADMMEAGMEAGLSKHSGNGLLKDIQLKLSFETKEEAIIVGILEEFRYFDLNNKRIRNRISAYAQHIRSHHPKKRLTRNELSKLAYDEFTANMNALFDDKIYKQCSAEIVTRVKAIVEGIKHTFECAPKPNQKVEEKIYKIINRALQIIHICNQNLTNRH